MSDTQKIDVLAVMGNAIDAICRYSPAGQGSDLALDLAEARAAVAELIDLREQILAYFARDLSPVRLYDICRQHPAIKRVGGAA